MTREVLTLRRLQREQAAWADYNFGTAEAVWAFLGVTEEVGELGEATGDDALQFGLSVLIARLAHAQLKSRQGIRGSEQNDLKAKDAIADILIFLTDYTTRRGWDLDEIVSSAWNSVKQRDWKRFPKNGRTE